MIKTDRHLFCTLALSCLSAAAGLGTMPTQAYPLDGYAHTGIGRLEEARRVQAGEREGTKQPRGGTLGLEAVDLRLLDRKEMKLPEIDAGFTRQVVDLLGEYADRYAIAVLDLSNLERPRYAEHNGNERDIHPGSVGKLLVAQAIFQALADTYPDDIDARLRVMRNTVITADDFIISDHHTVRIWNPETETLTRHPLQIGDTGTMWEFMDWMLSASSNAAASTLIKHGMLLKRFGTEYPIPHEAGIAFFKETPRTELAKLLETTLVEPVSRNGFDVQKLRQGSFFTATGQRKVPGMTSYATPRELMRFLLHMEQGRIVDEFSSRELKRLLYMTERRIRYASSPALWNAAVYFKSGSLYQCKPEPDFKCLKYHGNVKNFMNSVAIIESPAGDYTHYYFVTLMSNVLRKNSAVDHQTLATRIHKLITEQPAAKAEPAREDADSMADEPAPMSPL